MKGVVSSSARFVRTVNVSRMSDVPLLLIASKPCLESGGRNHSPISVEAYAATSGVLLLTRGLEPGPLG
jgi:hypothetical protein